MRPKDTVAKCRFGGARTSEQHCPNPAAGWGPLPDYCLRHYRDEMRTNRARGPDRMRKEAADAADAALKPTCRVIVPPEGAACGKPADCVLVFDSGGRSPACEGCAMNMQQLSESHGGHAVTCPSCGCSFRPGASMRVERL